MSGQNSAVAASCGRQQDTVSSDSVTSVKPNKDEKAYSNYMATLAR